MNKTEKEILKELKLLREAVEKLSVQQPIIINPPIYPYQPVQPYQPYWTSPVITWGSGVTLGTNGGTLHG